MRRSEARGQRRRCKWDLAASGRPGYGPSASPGTATPRDRAITSTHGPRRRRNAAIVEATRTLPRRIHSNTGSEFVERGNGPLGLPDGVIRPKAQQSMLGRASSGRRLEGEKWNRESVLLAIQYNHKCPQSEPRSGHIPCATSEPTFGWSACITLGATNRDLRLAAGSHGPSPMERAEQPSAGPSGTRSSRPFGRSLSSVRFIRLQGHARTGTR